MISRNQIKLIQSLSQKNTVKSMNYLLLKGIKGVQEFLQSAFVLHSLYTH